MFYFLRAVVCALVVLFCSMESEAAQIQVQQYTIEGWQDTRTNIELWIFANESFLTADGKSVLRGDPSNKLVFKRVACTVNLGAKTLTIAAFSIDSTTDSVTNPYATYSAWFYTATGSAIAPYGEWSQFRVPSEIASNSGCGPTGLCATWADIAAFNFTAIPNSELESYPKRVIDEKIIAAANNAGGGMEPVITRTPSGFFTNEFAMSQLATGLVKNTTITGVPGIAQQGVDYEGPLTFSAPFSRAGQVIDLDLLTNSHISPVAGILYSKLALSSSILNSDISPVAGILYSKLNISNSILNSDINSAAAIAYSKLNLSGSIVNADVAVGAAVAWTKINKSGATLADIPTRNYSDLQNIPDAFTPDLHAATHQNGGADEIATTTPGAFQIPKAGAGGTIDDGFIPSVVARDSEIDVQGAANEISSSGAGVAPTLSIASVFRITGKTATAPVKTGTALPGTCTTGDLFFKTNESAGLNLFGCTSTDTFTLLGDAGGAGGGITSLNGLIAATQTFSVVDDTNVTLLITSSGSDHEFQLGWLGQLAKSRQHSATAYTDQLNVYSAGAKQMFQPSATTAGLNIASGSDPSSPAQGDLFINGDEFKWRGASTTFSATPNIRSLSAGAGLTGGGDLSNDRSFAVGAGVGIAVNADDVAWSPDTFVANVNLWDGSQATRTFTFNLSGTDPVLTLSSGVVNLSTGAFQIGGVAVPTISSSSLFTNKDLGSGNSVSASLSWGDGIKQTFNPNGTNAGFNVGAHTANPSSAVNGDCYYNSSANEYRCFINSTWVSLGAIGANVLTDTSLHAVLNKTINVESTGNVITTVSLLNFVGASCNGASASANWDFPTSGAATSSCTGTTTVVGTLDFVDGSTTTGLQVFRLPGDWTGQVDVTLTWLANAMSSNAVRW